jgi:hypothetical protein
VLVFARGKSKQQANERRTGQTGSGALTHHQAADVRPKNAELLCQAVPVSDGGQAESDRCCRLAIEEYVDHVRDIATAPSLIPDRGQGRMALEDETDGRLDQRATEEPATGGEKICTLHERFDSQEQGTITLVMGKEGGGLPKRLDPGVCTAEKGQIRTDHVELNGDFSRHGTRGRIGKVHRATSVGM